MALGSTPVKTEAIVYDILHVNSSTRAQFIPWRIFVNNEGSTESYIDANASYTRLAGVTGAQSRHRQQTGSN